MKTTYADILKLRKASRKLDELLDAISNTQTDCSLQHDEGFAINGVTLGEALQKAFDTLCEYAESIDARNRKVEIEYFAVKTA